MRQLKLSHLATSTKATQFPSRTSSACLCCSFYFDFAHTAAMASSTTAPDSPVYEWFPARLLQKKPRNEANPYAVIVLNQPLTSLEPAQRVWNRGTFAHARERTPPLSLRSPNLTSS